ncbi:uncharacterized protein LOC127079787 [Lathyrus oleraceus]|uniref:uncharacterized protein LOC127079787 n=1 Tax=Pisum sativum TaxID=3888 RepID=UPI0021D008C3|nr:uncharacterized protein LOC127079787 [Pisum sativum]
MTATCSPIFKLLRKDQVVVWNEGCQFAFDKIQEYLQEPPILLPHVEGRPLINYLTVLDESMGYILGQQDETGKKEHAIYYLSKKFIDYETRYSMLEKICCALAWAAKRLLQYMYIFEKPTLNGWISRSQMRLSEYDIEYHTQKAIKGSVLHDYLAHQPVEDPQFVQFDFPDEDVMALRMKDNDEPPIEEARVDFDCTNNIVEYEACILGLEETIDMRIKFLEVFSDSALVINQIKGEWETRRLGLIPYRDYARRLSTFFTKVEFHHIPQDEN